MPSPLKKIKPHTHLHTPITAVEGFLTENGSTNPPSRTFRGCAGEKAEAARPDVPADDDSETLACGVRSFFLLPPLLLLLLLPFHFGVFV